MRIETLLNIKDTCYVIIKKDDQNTILGVSLNVLVTILMSITIFILGYILNHYYGKFKENRRLRLINIYILEQLKYLLKSLDNSIDNLKLLVNNLKQNRIQNIILNELKNILVLDLFELGISETYNALVNINKGKFREKILKFQKLRTTLHYISVLDKTTNDFVMKYIEDLNKAINNWSEGFEFIKKINVDLLNRNITNNISPSQDVMLSELFIIFNNIKNYDLIFLQENIIDRAVDILNKYNNDPRSYEYFEGTEKCKNSYYYIIEMKSAYNQTFLNNLEAYKTQREYIKELLDFFTSLKFKFITKY